MKNFAELEDSVVIPKGTFYFYNEKEHAGRITYGDSSEPNFNTLYYL